MMTIEQLEANQRDIITILEWLIPATTKQPTDRIAAAMQRLLPPRPETEKPDGERRREFLEKIKQPSVKAVT